MTIIASIAIVSIITVVVYSLVKEVCEERFNQPRPMATRNK